MYQHPLHGHKVQGKGFGAFCRLLPIYVKAAPIMQGSPWLAGRIFQEGSKMPQLSAHEVASYQGLGKWLAALDHMRDFGAVSQLSGRHALILRI